MKNALNIGVYDSGFSVNQINCIDIPIAAATGYFNPDNYYFYCFLYAIMNSWNSCENENSIDVQKQILQLLGLKLVPITIDDENSFESVLNHTINNLHNPILLYTKYSLLFYHEGYMESEYKNISHALIVNGIDPDKALINIKDYSHIEKDMIAFTKSYLLCDLALPSYVIKALWIQSNDAYLSQQKPCLYRLCTAEPTQIQDYTQLVCVAMELIKNNQDSFIDFIEHFNTYRFDYDGADSSSFLRKKYHNIFSVIFAVIEKYCKDFCTNEKNNYLQIKNFILLERSQITNILIADIFRSRDISRNDIIGLTNRIQHANNLLFSLLQESLNSIVSSKVIEIYPVAHGRVKNGEFADTHIDAQNLLIAQHFARLGETNESFVKFDISNIADKKIEHAHINLFCNYLISPAMLQTVRCQDREWSEHTIVWNNCPDSEDLYIVETDIACQQKWYAIDITESLCDSVAHKSKNVTYRFRISEDQYTGLNFFSKYAQRNNLYLELHCK